MKKIATILLSVLLLFSVAGCGNYDMMNKVESEVDKIKDEVKDDVSSMMPSNNNSSDTSSAKISAEQARKHALNHAKVNEKDARDFDIDKKTYNGKLCFEVDFETDTHEYEYLIDANTGEIVNWKSEENH